MFAQYLVQDGIYTLKSALGKQRYYSYSKEAKGQAQREGGNEHNIHAPAHFQTLYALQRNYLCAHPRVQMLFSDFLDQSKRI